MISPLSPHSLQGTSSPRKSRHGGGSTEAEVSPARSIPASAAPAPAANAAEKTV